MVTDSSSVGRVVRKDFIQANVNEIVNGQIISTSVINDLSEQKGEEESMSEENVSPEILEPEVLEPEVLDDDEPDPETLPAIPGNFTSFRKEFESYSRQCNSWSNAIVEKMAKREAMFKKAATKLDEENEELETLHKKYIYK